jgi:hypothetical protein
MSLPSSTGHDSRQHGKRNYYHPEQEQQEIIRHFEAGKPFPGKYRLLLFEENREEALAWNGKTNEVCNIGLSFQLIGPVDNFSPFCNPSPNGEKKGRRDRHDKTLRSICYLSGHTTY